MAISLTRPVRDKSLSGSSGAGVNMGGVVYPNIGGALWVTMGGVV